MSRRPARGGRWTVALVCWSLLVLACWQGALASSYTTGAVPRGSAVDVVGDSTAVVGVGTNASVRINETDRLVTVSSRFGRSVTVTVRLRAGSTDVGDLVVDGVVVGDAATFELGTLASTAVALRVPDDGSLVGRTVAFDVTVEATGLWGTVSNRNSTVTS